MTGEMDQILKLSSDEFYNALSQAIFQQSYSADDIRTEFSGFEKIEVQAVSDEGKKGTAIILVQKQRSKSWGKKDIIVIAPRGYQVNCEDYFSTMAKLNVQHCTFVQQTGGKDAVALLDSDGKHFLQEFKSSVPELKNFIVNYSSWAPLTIQQTGTLTQTTEKVKMPASLKLGNNSQLCSMTIESKWGGGWLANPRKYQINLTCVPAELMGRK